MAKLRGPVQVGTPDAGFTIAIGSGGALLDMRLRGLWSLDLAHLYEEQIRALWSQLAPTFHAIVDVSQSPIQPVEVAKVRSQLIAEAIQRGLEGVAYVTTNTLARMQMRRMAIEGGCKQVECFTAEDAAWAWLAGQFGIQRPVAQPKPE